MVNFGSNFCIFPSILLGMGWNSLRIVWIVCGNRIFGGEFIVIGGLIGEVSGGILVVGGGLIWWYSHVFFLFSIFGFKG